MADTSNHGSAAKSAENRNVYDVVVNQLLEEVRRIYLETGKVTDEILSALNNVFHTPLLPALDLVDNRSVSLLTCPAGRSLYQVIGSSGTPYTCFTTSNYCACPAYRFSVLKKEDHTMCKHILAIKLSNAMNLTKRLDVSDKEITSMLNNLD